MARRPIIAGNWKMFKNHLEAIQLVQKLSYLLEASDTKRVDVVLCPPFTSLRSVQTLIEADRLQFGIGAQNMHWEVEGAFTGEISASMLAKLKVRYVIVGHSERRQYFGETDETVNRKLKAAFSAGLTPICCVGETLEQRESGVTSSVVEGQVALGLEGLTPEQVGSMVIAYEPIWAIGTGRTASPADAQEVAGVIRGKVAVGFGQDVAEKVRIQYGGSVKAGNIGDIMAQPDVDGALVGGASLDPEDFALIIKYPA
ncbi:MAG: triose-phosphate isomerase [Actinomycetota bacterium]